MPCKAQRTEDIGSFCIKSMKIVFEVIKSTGEQICDSAVIQPEKCKQEDDMLTHCGVCLNELPGKTDHQTRHT